MATGTPFKFLEAYTSSEADRAAFFGREREISDLYQKLYEGRLVLVYGESGTGKTSLVQCGLSKKFADTEWLPAYIRRGDENILEVLKKELQRKARTPLPQYGLDSEGELRPLPLDGMLQHLYLDHYKPVFLVFDQFEELLLYGSAKEKSAFYDTIAELQQSSLQCRILLVLREEFLAQLSDFERRLPTLFDHRFRLERMVDNDLRQVVEGLANTVEGLKLEQAEKTIGLILENLRSREGERIQLISLQLYLQRLYLRALERQGISSSLSFHPGLVVEVGKIKKVLTQFLEEETEKIDAEVSKKHKLKAKGMAMAVLFEFVSSSQTRQPADTEELINKLAQEQQWPTEALALCLKRLQEAYLLKPLKAEA